MTGWTWVRNCRDDFLELGDQTFLLLWVDETALKERRGRCDEILKGFILRQKIFSPSCDSPCDSSATAPWEEVTQEGDFTGYVMTGELPEEVYCICLIYSVFSLSLWRNEKNLKKQGRDRCIEGHMTGVDVASKRDSNFRITIELLEQL